jgi:hypothetical protein
MCVLALSREPLFSGQRHVLRFVITSGMFLLYWCTVVSNVSKLKLRMYNDDERSITLDISQKWALNISIIRKVVILNSQNMWKLGHYTAINDHMIT